MGAGFGWAMEEVDAKVCAEHKGGDGDRSEGRGIVEGGFDLLGGVWVECEGGGGMIWCYSSYWW